MARPEFAQITGSLAELQDSHILVEAKPEQPKLVFLNPRSTRLFGASPEVILGKSFQEVLGIPLDEFGAIMVGFTHAALLHTADKFEEADAASPELKVIVGSQTRTLKTHTRIISTLDRGYLFDISLTDTSIEKRLKARLAAIEAINKLQGFDGLKNELGKIIESVAPFNSALIHLIDDDGNIIEFARWGEKPLSAIPFTHKDESEIISELVKSKKGIKINDTHQERKWKKTGREYIRSFLAAPIITRDREGKEKLIGILELNNNKPHAYEDEDLMSLISLAEYVANAFERNDAVMRDPLCPDIYIYKGVKFYGEREFNRSLRFKPPHPISAMFIDLDHFKQTNSAFGHLKTNDILIEVIKRLRKSTRYYDVIGRFGDEFMIVLPEADITASKHAAERFVESLKVPIGINGQQITLTASIGITQYDVHTDDLTNDFQTQIDHANHAMYISKDDGRDKITVWDISVEERWLARIPDSNLKIT